MRRRALVGVVAIFGVISLIAAAATTVVANKGFGRVIAWINAEPAPPPTPAAHPIPTKAPTPDELWLGKQGKDRFGYPTRHVSWLGMQRLLRDRRFEELTRHATELTRAAELDPRHEQWAIDAFAGFAFPDPELGRLLDEWVAHSPRSFAPYAARAAYGDALASFSLGTAAWEDTSQPRRDAFLKGRSRARKDLKRALAIHPNALGPNYQRLRMTRGMLDADQVFVSVNGRFPLSFAVYFERAFAVSSQHGSSPGALAALAEKARARLAENPRLALVDALADYQHALELERAKDYAGAIKAVDRALAHGEHAAFRALRGRAQLRRDDPSAARADLERALALSPNDLDALYDLSFAQYRLAEYENSAESCLRLALTDPLVSLRKRTACAASFEFAGRKHHRAGRPREALRAFDRALLLDPHHTPTRESRARLLRRGDPNRDPERITALVAQCQREGTFDAHRELNDALRERGRYAEIIEHWTRYLEAHPDDGSARLFRAGARASTGDFYGATDDAQRACDLRHPRGCMRTRQYREEARLMTASRARIALPLPASAPPLTPPPPATRAAKPRATPSPAAARPTPVYQSLLR